MFPRSYVEELRAEAAEHRTRAKRADEAVSRLTDAVIREAVTGIMADPSDLPVTADLLDEDGWPDRERITEAATALVAAKPHLGDRRPLGQLDGQGARSENEQVDLAGTLRRLAG